MLLYTNEEEIAKRMYDEMGKDNVSMYEVEDYVHWNYTRENEVTSNDINNIRYAYLRYAEKNRGSSKGISDGMNSADMEKDSDSFERNSSNSYSDDSYSDSTYSGSACADSSSNPFGESLYKMLLVGVSFCIPHIVYMLLLGLPLGEYLEGYNGQGVILSVIMLGLFGIVSLVVYFVCYVLSILAGGADRVLVSMLFTVLAIWVFGFQFSSYDFFEFWHENVLVSLLIMIVCFIVHLFFLMLVWAACESEIGMLSIIGTVASMFIPHWVVMQVKCDSSLFEYTCFLEEMTVLKAIGYYGILFVCWLIIWWVTTSIVDLVKHK